MATRIFQLALTVREYDEAIQFSVGTLDFELLEDIKLGDEKRWVRVAPCNHSSSLGATMPTGGASILLARAVTAEQRASDLPVGRRAHHQALPAPRRRGACPCDGPIVDDERGVPSEQSSQEPSAAAAPRTAGPATAMRQAAATFVVEGGFTRYPARLATWIASRVSESVPI
jgi:hypothetical protein